MNHTLRFVFAWVCILVLNQTGWTNGLFPSTSPQLLESIRLSGDGERFILSSSGDEFIPLGFNYDHDASGRLLEDYWHEEWSTVVEDYSEMKDLGAHVVRVHLQVAKFVDSPTAMNRNNLKQLNKLIRLAEETGLYLNITGLGCYHKQDVPEWYDEMNETDRWNTQAFFWEEIAKQCHNSPAIFCYDLMNEPVVNEPQNETEGWLLGELGGKYFVQRITLDFAGRTQKEIAKAWVDKLTTAIRKHDHSHLITVGVIPWVFTFPQAKPLFYSREVSEPLDFTSVHCYPKSGEIETALTALSAYDIGKPLVIEEMFPLQCGIDEMEQFIHRSKSIADGWISFYWGKTIEEYAAMEHDITASLIHQWLKRFQAIMLAH